MIVVKAPDAFDTQLLGNGRNVDKLKDLLALATIDTREVYVTSLVKCCPPKRPPSVQEIKACMGHLAKELKAVNPDVVVLMGTDALRAFNLMGEGGVNALQGQVIEKQFPHDPTLLKTWNVVVSTDPNALFMNPDPKLESKIVKSLRTAKSVVSGWTVATDSPDCAYKLIDNLADLDWMIEKIKEKGVFSFDTESRGLPWSKEPMICMQLCWGYDTGEVTTAVLPFYNHDPAGTDWKLKSRWIVPGIRERIIDRLKEIFEDASIPKIAHNIKYDMCVLRKHLDGLEVKGFLFDTMLMHHLLWEHPPHDLEYLADLELDTGDYSKELKKIVGRGRVLKAMYDCIPDDLMWKYGSKDAECTFRLMTIYFSRLKAQANLWELYQEEVHPFIRTLFKAEWYGVKLDTDVIEKLTEEFTHDQEELLKSLKAGTWPDFNPKASADVMEAIKSAGYFSEIEDKRTAKGYSTNKARLMKLAPKFPLVEDIMEHRKLVKLTGTYMNNAKELSEGADARARIGVMIHGTVNGRVSTRFLHQIPRLDENRIKAKKGNLRDMFIVNPGYKMVYGDYSQIELVTLAIMANDKHMLDVFRSGVDIHKATAAAFLEIPLDEVTEFNRSIGKNVNFGRTYGSVDGYALMKLTWMDPAGKEHPITEAMVKRGFASLDARFPAVARYFTDTVNEVSALNGIHTTRFGRMKRMGSMMNAPNEWARGEAERQAVNGSIQSPANSVTVRCLNNMDAAIEDRIQAGLMKEEDAFLVITVHDSGAWEVKNEHVDWFVPKLQEIASLPIKELDNFEFTMKVGTGASWSEAELNA
jgi:DNA polymerase-1